MMECADQPMRKWKMEQREQNVLGNCGTVPRNGTCVDDKYDSLRIIEMVSVLDPDTWMSRDVHGLDWLLHVWQRY